MMQLLGLSSDCTIPGSAIDSLQFANSVPEFWFANYYILYRIGVEVASCKCSHLQFDRRFFGFDRRQYDPSRSKFLSSDLIIV
mmetsp:Transcript_28213/g.45346  ORF Transcript_28213/g.45346 Transcript_28213/m.45346 type:complete len:83 (-) Transcript_28213:145-393(-)